MDSSVDDPGDICVDVTEAVVGQENSLTETEDLNHLLTKVIYFIRDFYQINR